MSDINPGNKRQLEPEDEDCCITGFSRDDDDCVITMVEPARKRPKVAVKLEPEDDEALVVQQEVTVKLEPEETKAPVVQQEVQHKIKKEPVVEDNHLPQNVPTVLDVQTTNLNKPEEVSVEAFVAPTTNAKLVEVPRGIPVCREKPVEEVPSAPAEKDKKHAMDVIIPKEHKDFYYWVPEVYVKRANFLYQITEGLPQNLQGVQVVKRVHEAVHELNDLVNRNAYGYYADKCTNKTVMPSTATDGDSPVREIYFSFLLSFLSTSRHE